MLWRNPTFEAIKGEAHVVQVQLGGEKDPRFSGHRVEEGGWGEWGNIKKP